MTQIALEWQSGSDILRKNINDMQSISIGRHPNCDIVLSDPHVSRQHASVYFIEGCFHIHNKSITNPVIFNDHWPINHNLRADLQVGDIFSVGNVEIKVVLPAPNSNGKVYMVDSSHKKHRCPGCDHLMDYGQEECSWCGSPLADSEVVELEPVKSFMDV